MLIWISKTTASFGVHLLAGLHPPGRLEVCQDGNIDSSDWNSYESLVVLAQIDLETYLRSAASPLRFKKGQRKEG